MVTEDTQLLEKDSGATDTGLHTEHNRLVASFGPRSRVRFGDKIQVVVDTERLHFFDPAIGLAVRTDHSNARGSAGSAGGWRVSAW